MPKRDHLRNLLSSVPGPWKQKQERAQANAGKEALHESESGTPTPAICEQCRNLDPDDPEFGDLFLWTSRLAGTSPASCHFCQFIYDAATAMVPSLASDSEIHASVESDPPRKRLDFRFGGRLMVRVYVRPGTLLLYCARVHAYCS